MNTVKKLFDDGDAVRIKDADPNEVYTVEKADNDRQRCQIRSWHGMQTQFVAFDQIVLIDDDEWDEPVEFEDFAV